MVYRLLGRLYSVRDAADLVVTAVSARVRRSSRPRCPVTIVGPGAAGPV